ncbi:killer toxin resistant protein [Thecaphora frezii]
MRALPPYAALLALLAFGLPLVAFATTASPPVKVQLRAPWKKPALSHAASPLILEIFEAANARDPHAFFPLVTKLTAPWSTTPHHHHDSNGTAAHPHHKAKSPHDHHHPHPHPPNGPPALAALSDSQLLSRAEDAIRSARLFGRSSTDASRNETIEASLELWHASLALHDQSPRVQAFMQLYHTLNLEDRWRSKAAAWNDGPEACISWVDFAGQVLCDEDDVVTAIRQAAATATAAPTSGQRPHPVRLLPFDHVLPVRGDRRSPVAGQLDGRGRSDELTLILYADPYSANFWRLHSLLEAYATGHREVPGGLRIAYVLRWRLAPDQLDDGSGAASSAADRTLYLGGYGAYLDLKKVDYLVIDDRKLRDDADVGQRLDGGAADRRDELEEAASAANRAWLEEQIGEVLPVGETKPTGDGSGEPDEPVEDEADSDAKNGRKGLSKEEIAELGLRASKIVAGSPDPLRALEELSQNFPLYAERLGRSSKLASWSAEAMVESLLALEERRVQPGTSALWLNGRLLEGTEVMPLGLIKVLSDERALIAPLLGRLAGGGLERQTAVDFLSSQLVGDAFVSSAADGSPQAFFDASDRFERRELGSAESDGVGAITWWNDVTQGRTAHWSNDLYSLLRPLWPGQFPQISVNLFNVVMVLDLGRRESCRFLSESIAPTIGRVALHWGLVPGGLDGGDGDSVQLARLFWEVFGLGGVEAATDFLRKLAKAGTADRVDLAVARDEAKLVLHAHLPAAEVAARLEAVLQGRVPEHQLRERMVRSYIDRLRATGDESPGGHVFVNGQHIMFGSQLVQTLHQAVQNQIQLLAPAIYHREFTADTENLETYFYDQPGALRFRSKLVFPPVPADGDGNSSRGPRIVASTADIVSALNGLDGEHRADVDVLTRHLYPSGEPQERHHVNTTLWLVGDLDSEAGAETMRKVIAALRAAEDADRFRIGFVHVPRNDAETRNDAAASPPLSALLHRLMQDGTIEQLDAAQLAETIDAYVPRRDNLDQDYAIGSSSAGKQRTLTADADAEVGRDAAAGHAAEKGWSQPAAAVADAFWRRAGGGVARAIGLDAARGPALLVHGKLVQGFAPHDIGPEDIAALVAFESSRKVEPVVRALSTLLPEFDGLESRAKSDLVAAASSVAARAYAVDAASEGVFVKAKQPRTAMLDTLGSDEHAFEVGDRATATLRFSVLLDPLSEAAQKWSTILGAVSGLRGVYVRVVLNPEVKGDQVPLRRFYRFSAPVRLRFDDEGREVGEELRFLGMPEEAVLTMGLDVPPAWLTMAEEAVYDLDNLRLADVPRASRRRGVRATYELKHLLIEGHARDAGGATPRGLELELATPDGGRRVDTMVMANLAYLQFKAEPGLWRLAIRAGRSAQLYEMVSVGNGGWESAGVEETGDDVTLDTLQGLRIYPVVRKRRGMEEESLLEETDKVDGAVGRTWAESSPWSTVALVGDRVAGLVQSAVRGARRGVWQAKQRVMGHGDSTASSKAMTRRQADINIFTVASGHLYERMASIMMLSVMAHTQRSVKFWFVENFLSPSFKRLLPHLAEEVGFEYELVTYAWPHWLRAQREKQRTIWGYKILFLDTLFPLGLKKVVFVDADQVVRADLGELVDLPLEGAVYGYPPMGDDAEDMEGYRFWKRGYWKDFLQGRTYHISALFVVDLERFRRVAAGDRLRGQYQALSADAGSLANLDQDLPNHMQTVLPIKTLDKEWLWCETWCSKQWLDKAKTIDLCSNPKTKEPKLDRARRQIREWEELDRRVEEVARKVRQQEEQNETHKQAGSHDEL